MPGRLEGGREGWVARGRHFCHVRPIKAVGGTVSLAFFNSLLLKKDLPQNHLVSLSFPPVLFFPNYLLLPLFHILVVRLSISTVFFTKKKLYSTTACLTFPPCLSHSPTPVFPFNKRCTSIHFFKKRVSRSRPGPEVLLLARGQSPRVPESRRGPLRSSRGGGGISAI